jgi:hypothetical protein
MAEIQSTKAFSEQFPGKKYKILGKTGYSVSVCGFGGYRINRAVKEHREALEEALLNGINLIDTSANYSEGGSEELIGEVLHNLSQNQGLEVESIVVVTKGGYIQGRNFLHALQREREGYPFPEVVKCSDNLWHCIHPEFLGDQISHSLKRLKLNTIDIYLLHNPEYYLNCSPDSNVEEYYRRIHTAFEYLEEEVARGRIRWYGISSNTFGESANISNFTSLEKIIEIAERINQHNHFAVIQLPINLFEKGGVVNINQTKSNKTLLKLAAEKGLGVLINRPLNAILGNKIFRLADFQIKENINRNDLLTNIDSLANSELEIIDQYKFLKPEEFSVINEYLSTARVLKESFQSFGNPIHFIELKNYSFIPRTNYVFSFFNSLSNYDNNRAKLLIDYNDRLNKLLSEIEIYLCSEKNILNYGIHKILNRHFPPGLKVLNLSEKAILLINSLKEVTVTLVGMRKKEYVKNIVNCLETDFLDNPEDFWFGTTLEKTNLI